MCVQQARQGRAGVLQGRGTQPLGEGHKGISTAALPPAQQGGRVHAALRACRVHASVLGALPSTESLTASLPAAAAHSPAMPFCDAIAGVKHAAQLCAQAVSPPLQPMQLSTPSL